MFPSQELPAIMNDKHVNKNKSEKKTNDQWRKISWMIFILIIIVIAIFIGLFSIYIPKPSDSIITTLTAENVILTLILPITTNGTNRFLFDNNSSITDNYLNKIQRNILMACLQSRLNSVNITEQMIVVSIDEARIHYNEKNQRKKRRHQLSSSDLIQIQLITTIQCTVDISQALCQQYIRSVFNNGQSLQCTATDQIKTTVSSKIVLPHTQHWRQVGQLFLAFGLTSLVGLERQLRGKNAGLRTHSIVGTSSALILQVSKYGFMDVIYQGIVVVDPSRIAAQIISGISFLGAGLIITRQRAIRGLTTAASVWSASAIGMAAGAGLWVLSIVVTGLHFVILLGFLPLEKRLPVFDRKSPFHVKNDDDDDDENEIDNQNLDV